MNLSAPPQTAYDQIEWLVKKYKDLPTRARHAYNEDNTRKDFILPLFRALEWNIDDMREVAAEEKISRGFVDFSFRIGGVPRFMLETKRIGEDLNKVEFAQQAIDYAYHKDVTWAVLSDFEGLKVLNAEIKESNPLSTTFKQFTFEEYLPRLDEVWMLSRSAFAEGALDRAAEKVFKKSIKTPIAQSLFDNLTQWRESLYKNLRAYNRMWTDKDIDDAVQRILDRLIFIRTAEDRDVEGDKLLSLVRVLNDPKNNRINDLIPALSRRFRELDGIYNSQIFAPHFSENLTYEPQTLVDIIQQLYGSAASFIRYNFAFIDADVLGRAYEQYLGYVVSERQQFEAKKAKRKSQGIYYTPTFVVKYIVQQTLGRYLGENGYNPAHPVRVLDPACGSGSFLIEAFDVLDQYIARQTGQSHGVNDMHDYARHRQILSTNIYGVDKDAQAVEVAQLNLLLKALNHREKLPQLENIRCGDSLISGTPQELEKFFGTKAKEKNAFNWEREFDKVMSEGGFEVIIGNPPYVRPLNLPSDLKEFLWAHYPTFVGKSDLYCCFIQRTIDLAKPGGYISFVVSDGWLRLDSFEAIRKYMLSRCKIVDLVDLPDKVFEDATVKTAIFILQKESSSASRSTNRIQISQLGIGESIPKKLRQIRQSVFENAPRNIFDPSLSTGMQSFRKKMESGNSRLGDILDIRFGLKTGDDAEFIHSKPKSKQHKPLLRGENVHRYRIEFAGEYVWYVPEKMREHRKTARPGDPERFEQHKILVRDTGQHLECALDLDKYYAKDVLILTRKKGEAYSLHYIAGLINSKVMRFYYETAFPTIHVQNSELTTLPIHRINFDDKQEKKQHDAIVALVEEMLGLQKEFAEETRHGTPHAESLERRIAQVDHAIDAAVYRLYDLSAEEIALIDKSAEPHR